MTLCENTIPLRLVPCLDVRDGRIVKGVRFANLRDAGDPVERAELYERDGADELCLLDVSATARGKAHAIETVRRVRRVLGIPLTVGGGVRSVEDARRLLEAGADKVSVNSAAVEREGLIAELATAFGSQCVVLAIDAKRCAEPSPHRFDLTVAGGRRILPRDAVRWAARAVELGAGEVLLTSWDRDGTGDGYDLELIEAVRRAVNVPLIASGGASSAADLAEAARCGASAVLCATLLHDGVTTSSSLKNELRELGLRVRP